MSEHFPLQVPMEPSSIHLPSNAAIAKAVIDVISHKPQSSRTCAQVGKKYQKVADFVRVWDHGKVWFSAVITV